MTKTEAPIGLIKKDSTKDSAAHVERSPVELSLELGRDIIVPHWTWACLPCEEWRDVHRVVGLAPCISVMSDTLASVRTKPSLS